MHHSNFLAAPIRTAKEIYGVIRLSKGGEDTPFSEGDESLLIMYGNFLGSSLQTLQFEQTGTLLVKPKWEGRYPVIRKCSYVLMPFSKPWSNNVRNAIRRAVESQDLIFRIADEESGSVVMKDIWKGICEARIIIADLSTANPNVAYEVGLSDVLGKEMVLLAQNPNEVPFDFAGARLL